MRLQKLLGLVLLGGLLLAVFILGAQYGKNSWPFRGGLYAGARTAIGSLLPKPPVAAAVKPAELLERIRGGGYILYFRHASRDFPESILAFDLIDIESNGENFEMACLNNVGKAEAEAIGRLFAKAKIPVGTIASSPSCRAKQTAMLAFKRIDVVSPAFLHITVTPKPDEFGGALRDLPMRPGTNTIVSGHTETIDKHKDIISEGVDVLDQPLKQSGFYVLKRDKEKFAIIGMFSNVNELARAIVPAAK